MWASVFVSVGMIIGVCILVILRATAQPDPLTPTSDEREREAAVARALMHGMHL
jgi:hypothetical protein